MSKVGNSPITIPEKVETSLNDRTIVVKGPKGELTETIVRGIEVSINDGVITLTRKNENWKVRAAHGLMRALIANMVHGVSTGWEKNLELIGTGYRAKLEGKKLVLSVGYSHPVPITPPEGIEFSMDGQTKITIKGANKQVVGETAAQIRRVRPPEPYKGKGIKYENEVILRKAGKAAKA